MVSNKLSLANLNNLLDISKFLSIKILVTSLLIYNNHKLQSTKGLEYDPFLTTIAGLIKNTNCLRFYEHESCELHSGLCCLRFLRERFI